MHGISYRSKLFLAIKYIILLSIVSQILATIYVIIELPSVSQWVKKLVFMDFIDIRNMKWTIAVVAIGYGGQQVVGAYGVYRESLTGTLLYTFVTSLETIVWLVGMFGEHVLIAPLLVNTVLIALLLLYSYRMPRDGVGHRRSRGQTMALVQKLFGGNQPPMDELYVTGQPQEEPQEAVHHHKRMDGVDYDVPKAPQTPTDAHIDANRVGYPRGQHRRPERDSTYVKF